MNLLQIRTQFIKLSGRTDLVVDTIDYADNGADYYIQAGSRSLDRDGLRTPQTDSRKFMQLETDHFLLYVPNCRAIEKVYIGNTEVYYPLERVDYANLRDYYGDALMEIDSGDPLYWCNIPLRHSPDFSTYTGDISLFIGSYVDLRVDVRADDYRGLLILPPTSDDVFVDIFGLFENDTLIEDESENYWSTKEPDLLVMAGLRELERAYRNTQGVRDWTGSINEKLLGLDKDTVESTIRKYENKMRG